MFVKILLSSVWYCLPLQHLHLWHIILNKEVKMNKIIISSVTTFKLSSLSSCIICTLCQVRCRPPLQCSHPRVSRQYGLCEFDSRSTWLRNSQLLRQPADGRSFPWELPGSSNHNAGRCRWSEIFLSATYNTGLINQNKATSSPIQLYECYSAPIITRMRFHCTLIS